MMKHPLTLSALALLVCASAQAATVDLRVLAATVDQQHDGPRNMMDFDYYKDIQHKQAGGVGAPTATNAVLVEGARSAPARRHTSKGLKPGDVHPVYKAMNTLDYVVGNIGNHEFNYGLDYLKNAIAGAKFPYINANVIDAKTQNRCSRRTSSSIRR